MASINARATKLYAMSFKLQISKYYLYLRAINSCYISQFETLSFVRRFIANKGKRCFTP